MCTQPHLLLVPKHGKHHAAQVRHDPEVRSCVSFLSNGKWQVHNIRKKRPSQVLESTKITTSLLLFQERQRKCIYHVWTSANVYMFQNVREYEDHVAAVNDAMIRKPTGTGRDET